MTTQPSILLFGASGQIGSALCARLNPAWMVRALDRADVDLRDPRRIEDIITRTRPRLIINAAAYTAVDTAESDAELARHINADAPAIMARSARAAGAALLHFSTDYVFDGRKGAPYTETDAPHPLSVYGRTKLAGDAAIEHSGIPFLILRTSWVYAAHGKNFLRTIATRAATGQRLRVVNDQTGTPTSVPALVDAVSAILERTGIEPAAIAPHAGVYNLTAAGSTTWFGFAKEIVRRLELDAAIDPISTADFGAAAKRPAYSVLDTTKVRDTFGIDMADWRDQLADVLRDPAFSSR